MELTSLDAGLRTDALRDVWDFAVGGPGKQTRARLLTCAEAVARGGIGDPDPRLDSAIAGVELFHLATLAHDDVMDGSRLRRGVLSLPARFGVQMAAAGGGLFFGRALTLFARCGADALVIATETVERLCEAGDESLMKKPRGTDLANGNYSLAVIYALEEAPELLDVLIGGAAMETVMRLVLDTDGIARARADARRWIDDAKDAVRVLPAADGLLAIADEELERLAGVQA
jgi:geranylgeranyl pyrophosphate synthase